MTISSETRKAGPTPGNGVATAFPFAFKVFNTTDIAVTLTVLATGVASTLALNTDYTVILNADQDAQPGGSVTYNPISGPLSSLYSLTISSNVDHLQGTNLTDGGAFLPQVIEDMVDKATIGIQQLNAKLGLALVFPLFDPVANANSALPAWQQRAGMLLSFDANGNPQVVAPSAQSATALSAALAAANGASLIGYNAQTLFAYLTALDLYRANPTGILSLNGGPIGEFRNPVTNGNYQIDQRNEGASQTFTAAAALAWCVDAWYAACSGANITGQQVTVNGGKRYKFTGAASNTGVTFGHRMLSFDTFHYAGNTATLMVKAASSSITTLTWTAYYATSNNAFGTLGAPTKTQIATGTFTISSTETPYAVQISVPSAATTGIEIVFTTGALLATQTLQFGSVALIPSSASETNFPRRPKSVELQLSQRFYWKSFPQGTAPAQNAGVSGALTIGSNAASTFAGSFQLPVMWTAATTTTTYNPSAANANFRDTNNGADRTLSSANPSDAQINLSGLAGVANGINRIHVTLDAPIP